MSNSACRSRSPERIIGIVDTSKLIYDWNTVGRRTPVALNGRFELHDETLRDGLQNPSVRTFQTATYRLG